MSQEREAFGFPIQDYKQINYDALRVKGTGKKSLRDLNDMYEKDRADISENPNEVQTFRQYAEGNQNETIPIGMKRMLSGLLGLKNHQHSDNICNTVIAAPAGRVSIARFDVENERVRQFLLALFIYNQIPKLEAAVNWSTIRDGNFVVTAHVDKSNGRIIFTREPWWDGKTGSAIIYDDLGKPLYYMKDWIDPETQKMRRLVCWPDRFERYIQNGEGWEPYRLNGDTEWPVPWVRRDGSPIGIMAVHFPNINVDSLYGKSILAGGVIGLQDEINDIQRDITAAARYTAFQIITGTGIPDRDKDGKEVEYNIDPGLLLYSTNTESRWGHIPAGDITSLIKAYETKLRAVSRMTGTPMHIITNDWPTGEALLRTEMPLVTLSEMIVASLGPAWASLMHKATVLHNVANNDDLDEDSPIRTAYHPVDRRDPLTLSQIAVAQLPYASIREALRIVGKSPQEIERIMKERHVEAIEKAQLAQIPLLEDYNLEANNNFEGIGSEEGVPGPVAPFSTGTPRPPRVAESGQAATDRAQRITTAEELNSGGSTEATAFSPVGGTPSGG